MKIRTLTLKLLSIILCGFLIISGCSSQKYNNGNHNSINSLGEQIQQKANSDHEMATEAIDVFEQAKNIGRAINLGNMLEAPNEGDWGLRIEQYYFNLIKEAGFDSVRVPIRFSNKTTDEAPFTIDESFLQRVDWVIEQGLKYNLNIIVDLHHFEEMMSNPFAEKQKLLAIWEQLSLRYKDLPQNVYFELLNEPNGALSSFTWNEFLKEVIDIIRTDNPNRTLIVGGTDWNSINGLYQLALPEEDRNIIATFHYYGPFLFTHQGAEWVTSEYWTRGVTWPGPPATPVEPIEAAQKVQWVRQFFEQYNSIQGAENPASKETLIKELERAAKWSEDHNRPVFLGEFGAYNSADIDSRVAWTRTVRTEAERLGMSWAYWEFASGFGIYSTSSLNWNQPLVDALLANP